ncbi:MAG: cobalt ECF transporter T component CbiQ [Coriobacteriia bacterium]|nr:cobalt ECF transporter T component CbiQ [Coriobacteriia bacterium]
MSRIESGIYQLGQIDHFASRDTAVHRVDPRAKVLATLVFLVCVVSFGKYEVLSLLPFAVFPIALASEGEVPLRYVGSRLLIAAPFAVFVGLFNPLLDRAVIGQIAGIDIVAGWVSYASIIVRFMLTTAAALVLICVTGMNRVCMAIERLGAPDIFATQLLFLYRYIFVLAEEVLTMSRARSLRSFAGRGMGLAVYGQILGQLLLRTYARAQRIYNAMLCRGFDGHVRTVHPLAFAARDWAFLLGWSAVFIVFRLYNVPLLVGQVVTGILS